MRRETSTTERAGRASGFTLLELLVVLALLGLLAGVVLPRLTTPGIASAADRTVRELANALATARNDAIFRNRESRLVLDVARRLYAVDGRASERLPGDLSVTIEASEPEVAGDGTAAIRFHPDGSSSGGTIVVQSPEGARHALRVNWLTGRITIDG